MPNFNISSMAAVVNVDIVAHTTSSVPRPHILYVLRVTPSDGDSYEVSKRYSDFVALHTQLQDPYSLPPKRLLVTTFLPSAWIDDYLIAERKSGLTEYLNNLIGSIEYHHDSALAKFLTPTRISTPKRFDLEDALPSTLSRKAAQELLKKDQVRVKATTPIAAAYYPDWASDSNPPSALDFSKFDILLFAFATPNSSNGLNWDSGATSTLKSLVSAANSSGQGTKVVLSIGGWDGSHYFSQAVGSSSARSTFVNACVSAVNTYGLSGIDIDWEYPNESGAGNPHSSSDAANLLTFFQSLRSALGNDAIISAAVTDLPWTGSNGSPLTDVSAYAKVMSYVNIMNYDINGASSNPGPNAPLGDFCNSSSQPQYNANAALSQWTAANFPASQLMLGIPLYGYVSNSSATHLSGSYRKPEGFKASEHAQRVMGGACALPTVKEGEEEEGEPNFLKNEHKRVKTKRPGKEDRAKVQASGDLSSYTGQQIPFNQIVALGALSKTSSGTYEAANGYTEGWDDCSDTPFLYDTSRTTVVTYDDTYSIGDKATFVKQNGMAGCFTWSLEQDDGYTLQDAIRSSLGK